MKYVIVFRYVDIYIEIFNKILLIPFTYIKTTNKHRFSKCLVRITNL